MQKYSQEQIRGLFCDTQFEHPKTYAHVDWIANHYGIRIDRVCEGDVLSKCVKYGRFPGAGARHCTDELKIRPTKNYIRDLAKEQGGFEVWFGMRSEESNDRANRYSGKVCEELYAPHEILPSKYPKYLQKIGVMFRLAILDWSRIDVLEFLDGEENPLYKDGFDRVGCFPCQAAGDRHKERCYQYDDFGKEQYIKVKTVSQIIKKPMWTSQEGEYRNERQCGLFCS